MEFSLAKAISTVSFPPNPFFSFPSPSDAVLPPPLVKGPSPSWFKSLRQQKAWLGQQVESTQEVVQQTPKLTYGEQQGAGRESSSPPFTGSLLDLLKMWLQPSPFSPASLPAVGSQPLFCVGSSTRPVSARQCRELNQQKATELSPPPAKKQFLASHRPLSVHTKNQINTSASTPGKGGLHQIWLISWTSSSWTSS